MTIEIHTESGEPTSVTMPYEEYERLVAFQEDFEDSVLAETVKERITSGEEECFPLGLVEQVVNGENPVKLYREYRGLTQQQLSEKSCIERSYIAQIETGRKRGSVDALKEIAAALGLDVDDII